MAKETIMKMKREPTVWDNILTPDRAGKGSIYKIYKELMRLNNRNTNNPIKNSYH